MKYTREAATLADTREPAGITPLPCIKGGLGDVLNSLCFSEIHNIVRGAGGGYDIHLTKATKHSLRKTSTFVGTKTYRRTACRTQARTGSSPLMLNHIANIEPSSSDVHVKIQL